MRICHFSDSHLGYGQGHARRATSGLTMRQEDVIQGFRTAVERIIDIRPDLCIHSGDLFDSVRPLNSIMAIAGEQLYRLAEAAGIPTVIIAGNHDAPKQPFVGAAIDVYRQIDNLYVASGSRLEVFELLGGKVHAIPHCLTGELLQDEIGKCRPEASADFNILVMHGVVAGMPEFSMADLGEQEIPKECFEPFDYVALGHYHNFSQVSARAFYAGATERTSQSERDFAKGFVLVDMDPFNTSFVEIPSRVMLDIPILDVSGKRGDEIAAAVKGEIEKVGGEDKVVRLTVTGASEEALKTIPSAVIADLKQRSYALDIRFEKDRSEIQATQFGRTAIGRLDESFVAFLQTVDLSGFDLERLRKEGLKYLAAEQ